MPARDSPGQRPADHTTTGSGSSRIPNLPYTLSWIVRASVITPRNLSKDQKELMRKLAQSMGSEIKPQDGGFMGKIKDALG